MRKIPEGKRALVDVGSGVKTLRIGTSISGYLSQIAAVRTALRLSTTLESTLAAERDIKKAHVYTRNTDTMERFCALADLLSAFIAGDDSKLENKDLRGVVKPLLRNNEEKSDKIFTRLRLMLSDVMTCDAMCAIVKKQPMKTDEFAAQCKQALMSAFEQNAIFKHLSGNAALSMRSLAALTFDLMFKVADVEHTIEWDDIASYYECSVIVIDSENKAREFGEFERKVLVLEIDENGNCEALAELMEYNLDKRTFVKTDRIILDLLKDQ